MSFPDREIQYLEFAAKDMQAQKQFYHTVFGWKFTDYGSEYTAFEGVHVHGGFYPGEVVQGSILPVVYTTDLEATLEKVKAAAAPIVRDIFSFPGGRRFHFNDPDGNELAVWTAVAGG